mgnify:CR=1 FL=1
MKDKKSLRKKIAEDPDFIYCPRLGNSLKKLLDKHPDGIDEERMEKVLLLTPKEIDAIFQSALTKLREFVKD